MGFLIFTNLWLFGNFKMSADEDTELRDLVAQTLEANGVLGKIRVYDLTIPKIYVTKNIYAKF
jgi:hypothetical protein